jgi:hypothetical protein
MRVWWSEPERAGSRVSTFAPRLPLDSVVAREPYRGSRNCVADNNCHPLGPLPYVRMKSIRSVPAPFTSVCEPVTTAVSPVMRTSDVSVVSD